MSSTSPIHNAGDTGSNVTPIADRLSEPPDAKATKDAAADAGDERASTHGKHDGRRTSARLASIFTTRRTSTHTGS